MSGHATFIGKLFAEKELHRRENDELKKYRDAYLKLREAVEFSIAPDMWVSDGENNERFQYKYTEWYQDTLNSAIKEADGILGEMK